MSLLLPRWLCLFGEGSGPWIRGLGRRLGATRRSHMLDCESRVRHPQPPCVHPAARQPSHPDTHSSVSAWQPQLHPARIASLLALFSEQQVQEWGPQPAAPLPLIAFHSLLGNPPPSSLPRPMAPRDLLALPRALPQLPKQREGDWETGMITRLETALYHSVPQKETPG